MKALSLSTLRVDLIQSQTKIPKKNFKRNEATNSFLLIPDEIITIFFLFYLNILNIDKNSELNIERDEW